VTLSLSDVFQPINNDRQHDSATLQLPNHDICFEVLDFRCLYFSKTAEFFFRKPSRIVISTSYIKNYQLATNI